ncbi:hypothetical protein GPECTOR_67g264 [Gonium pectorale]|uniref:Uncharacterized protein n=1 Tax=Gonium pectorale TaxID=33097 RepID=A0A150G3L9_GONPE|nr:hypothetical protein GPECTOR_67g264 [Gonium pectorale]|eukprot:KXZ44424.1 hypothetical protein GPECTOR_67g264 [Gonium pectorale]
MGSQVLSAGAFLRKHHTSVNPRTQWAQNHGGSGDFLEGLKGSSFLTSAAALNGRSVSSRLPSGQLEITRVKDANQHGPSDSVVNAVRFHPNGQVLLTGGLDKKLRFFQVDGVRNTLLHEVHFEDMPLMDAGFVVGRGTDAAAAESAVLVGRRSFMYLFDLQTARAERLTAPSSMAQKSLERVAVSPSRLTFADYGNTGSASSLAVSSDGRYLATGSRSGTVNVYLRTDFDAASVREKGGACSVTPAREVTSLTTDTDTLSFSPDSQILAIGSRMKRDALRLLHLPSMTAFTNWPTSRSPLGYVHALDFSPNCGFFAVGNAKGRTLLYRLHHYERA